MENIYGCLLSSRAACRTTIREDTPRGYGKAPQGRHPAGPEPTRLLPGYFLRLSSRCTVRTWPRSSTGSTTSRNSKPGAEPVYEGLAEAVPHASARPSHS